MMCDQRADSLHRAKRWKLRIEKLYDYNKQRIAHGLGSLYSLSFRSDSIWVNLFTHSTDKRQSECVGGGTRNRNSRKGRERERIKTQSMKSRLPALFDNLLAVLTALLNQWFHGLSKDRTIRENSRGKDRGKVIKLWDEKELSSRIIQQSSHSSRLTPLKNKTIHFIGSYKFISTINIYYGKWWLLSHSIFSRENSHLFQSESFYRRIQLISSCICVNLFCFRIASDNQTIPDKGQISLLSVAKHNGLLSLHFSILYGWNSEISFGTFIPSRLS